MDRYDLVIIGSGPGGYIAGLYAAGHGLKVCVIEKDLLGGTCLNKGCIPTKAMLYSASLLSRIRESSVYGVEVGGVSVNFPEIVSRREGVVLRLRTGIETLFRARKIDLKRGSASFTSRSTVTVGRETLEFGSALIATGSRPSCIPGIKVDESHIYSSDGIWGMKELPKSMAIIGGGVIGCEFATLFNALGADVTVIELLDGLIATQSREASRKLETVFKKRGISVLTGAKVSSIMKDGAVRVSLEDGRVVSVEKVLVAVGRTPNTEGIGAEGAGIKTEGGRVMIDGHCRTNVKGVYAAGDCTGGLLLAHKASYEGKLACDNIMGRARTADYSCIPTTVYTDPEIASVGITEEEAKAKYPGVKVAKFPYLASGKAYLMGKTEGFIKIAGGSDGEILGIEIFGEGACDLIGEAVLAKTLGAKVKDLAETVHAHPTLSEIFQEAAHIFDGKGIHTV